ncbi:uncharacterized protein [Haliotis asinina]|uniref:uncharacterized protein isoform X2 n=1 Tax=Haliotis asinina TaxID=109174 RepID=UPI0035318163
MYILGLPILCVVIASTSALIMPRANKTTTPDQNTHHTGPDHMDQVSVDSTQARTVFRDLTLGNNTLSMQDLERFLNSSDTNDDGQVTSDEFLQTWFQYNVGSLVNAVAFFFNIDVNKDDRITADVDLKRRCRR